MLGVEMGGDQEGAALAAERAGDAGDDAAVARPEPGVDHEDSRLADHEADIGHHRHVAVGEDSYVLGDFLAFSEICRNATRAPVCSLVEHVVATDKRRMCPAVRSFRLVRATARITLANLAYIMLGLVWVEGRGMLA